MGFFDDINPVKVVSNVVNEVKKGVDNVGRSDIGKVVEAVTAPARGAVRTVEAVAKGDLEGAAANVVNIAVTANPIGMAANASSTVREIMDHDTVNAVTMGWSRDQKRLVDMGRDISYGKKPSAEFWSTNLRQGVRNLAIAGAVVGAPVATSYATQAVQGATVSGTLQGLGGAAGIYKAAERGDYGAIADKFIPGSGNLVNQLTQAGGGGGNSGGGGSAPNVYPTTPQVVQTGGGLSTQNMLLIGGGITALLAIAILMRNRG